MKKQAPSVPVTNHRASLVKRQLHQDVRSRPTNYILRRSNIDVALQYFPEPEPPGVPPRGHPVQVLERPWVQGFEAALILLQDGLVGALRVVQVEARY